jgi:hypothetical protein
MTNEYCEKDSLITFQDQFIGFFNKKEKTLICYYNSQ